PACTPLQAQGDGPGRLLCGVSFDGLPPVENVRDVKRHREDLPKVGESWSALPRWLRADLPLKGVRARPTLQAGDQARRREPGNLRPESRRARVAIAVVLPARLGLGAYRCIDVYRWHRPGEAHSLGRPTSWRAADIPRWEMRTAFLGDSHTT